MLYINLLVICKEICMKYEESIKGKNVGSIQKVGEAHAFRGHHHM